MIYLELFLSFLKIGLFSIGGGYAAIPLIQNQIVIEKGWINMTEFTDIITIAEMTPGPIAINSATFVGTRVGGLPGAIIATLGFILPSVVIVSTLAFLYFKYKKLTVVQGVLNGVRPAIVGMIALAAISIILLTFFNNATIDFSVKNINFASIIIFIIGLVLLRYKKINPIYIISGAGLIGFFVF